MAGAGEQLSSAERAGRVRAWVDPDALRSNLVALEALAGAGNRVLPVIKADAYGHGAIRTAIALQHRAEGFAVAALSEAETLRAAGLRVPLCVLGGVQSAADWGLCEQLELDVVVHAPWQWEQLRSLQRPPRYWLKFDSGMGRLGFPVAMAAALAAEAKGRGLLGVMTHLASADEAGNAHTQAQLDCFETAVRPHFAEQTISVANSAGMLLWPQSRAGVSRPGVLLYGVSPLDTPLDPALGFRPALRLEARLLDVKDLPAGHSVGYGAEWTAAAPSRVGIVAIGYADGLFRCLGTGGFALSGPEGERLPLRGRVSMDMIAVELSAESKLQPGDWLGVWGAGAMPVEEAARHAGTIPYELMTALGGRVAHGDRALAQE